jgi:hypothetical protein
MKAELDRRRQIELWIALMHDGPRDVRSDPGSGATFTIRLRQASIGTCPGLVATRWSQAPMAGYESSSKPPSGATCVYA